MSEKARILTKVLSWVPVVAWMTVIFHLSSKTGINVPNPLTYVAHFTEYLILALLMCLALSLSTTLPRRSLLVAALLAASSYGITDELHQAFVPTREASLVDWLVDTGGATAAALLWRPVLQGAIRSRSFTRIGRRARGDIEQREGDDARRR